MSYLISLQQGQQDRCQVLKLGNRSTCLFDFEQSYESRETLVDENRELGLKELENACQTIFFRQQLLAELCTRDY